VGLVALGFLEQTPEQAGCYQPRIATGVSIVTLALSGIAVATWAVAARRPALGLVATAALAGGVVAAGLLAPEAGFGPC
jgi:hypothetical protein